MEQFLTGLKLVDVLLTLFFGVVAAVYVRAKLPALGREAEEKRAAELRNYIADQDRILAGQRQEYEQLTTQFEQLKARATRQAEDLNAALRAQFRAEAYIRLLQALLKQAGIVPPPREEGS